VFEPLRPWLDPLDRSPLSSLERLNLLSEQAGLKVESGKSVRFVAASGSEGRYGD
jgi:hypothetical protein